MDIRLAMMGSGLVLLLGIGTVAAQPASDSPNQFGDRQVGHFGDPGAGYFGNPASGAFNSPAIKGLPPGQKPLEHLVPGQSDAPRYVSLPKPADGVTPMPRQKHKAGKKTPPK